MVFGFLKAKSKELLDFHNQKRSESLLIDFDDLFVQSAGVDVAVS